MTSRALINGLLLLALLAALGYFASLLQGGDPLSRYWIDQEIRGKGWAGGMLFLAVGALATALSLPRQVLAFLGGYAFGFVSGTLLTTLATLLGCVLGFYYARWFGRAWVQQHFPGRLRKLDDFLRRHPFSMALVIRLLPVGHNASTNLLAGVSSVRGLPFFAGSTLGFLPQNLVFALAGSGVDLDPGLRTTLAAVLLLISTVLGVWLYRQHRQALVGIMDKGN
jgi:uncharacterized membrane protein YdjX (TVP38/TMEM64 family)